MWHKNLQLYRLPAAWPVTADAIEQQLSPHAFVPATSMDLLRQGWAAPRGPGAPLVHVVGSQFLMQLKTEKKLLPASVINQVAAARAIEMEEAQGFAPGKKAMKELKERVADELLPRAFSIASTTAVWIDPVNGWLVIDAASPSKADEVVKLLLKSIDRLPLERLQVRRSPTAAMTEWLQADDVPASFTVDMDAKMRATGESKAEVTYKRHTLEVDDVRRHIAAGKQCTRLAMTWNDRISFVLDETLAIKSVKPLDVIKESAASTKNDDESFDSNFVLMAGELAQMLADLVEALGGEAASDTPAATKSAVKVHAAASEINKLLAEDGATAVLRGPGVEVAFAGAAAGHSRKAVELASKMYKAHVAAKHLLGDRFPARMAELAVQIKATAAAMSVSELGAVTHLCSITENPYLQMETLAAAVELAEPGTGEVPDGAIPLNGPDPDQELYDKAVAIVRGNQRASISLVQRHLRVGYNRAARLIEAMEFRGVVSAQASNGDRIVLPTPGVAP